MKFSFLPCLRFLQCQFHPYLSFVSTRTENFELINFLLRAYQNWRTQETVLEIKFIFEINMLIRLQSSAFDLLSFSPWLRFRCLR